MQRCSRRVRSASSSRRLCCMLCDLSKSASEKAALGTCSRTDTAPSTSCSVLGCFVLGLEQRLHPEMPSGVILLCTAISNNNVPECTRSNPDCPTSGCISLIQADKSHHFCYMQVMLSGWGLRLQTTPTPTESFDGSSTCAGARFHFLGNSGDLIVLGRSGCWRGFHGCLFRMTNQPLHCKLHAVVSNLPQCTCLDVLCTWHSYDDQGCSTKYRDNTCECEEMHASLSTPARDL